MQTRRETITPTQVKLTVSAEADELQPIKQQVLERLSQNVRVPGFRPGKAPAAMVEKAVDQSAMQTEFLEQAVNSFFVQAVQAENLRPVAQPAIELTKFVPYQQLEFTAEVTVVGDVTLADYKKIKLAAKPVSVTAADVNEVLENLRRRAATKEETQRAAKKGDEVIIDFAGTDAKSAEPIAGADGKDYPLLIGSGTFIPGFEEELIGAKPGGVKTFKLTFPADYGVKALQKKEVAFAVTAHKVQELKLPKLDDDFAKSVGPFKTLAELKADIKKQLTAERQNEAQQEFDNELVGKIADKSEVAIPDQLIEDEIDRLEQEEKRNVTYRGQTWEEHLNEEAITAEEHRARQRPAAEKRVKAGLVLAEISDKEKVEVPLEELEMRIQLLKGQYPNANMQAELDKPENRRDIHSRMLTEKTLDKLRTYATSKPVSKASK